MVAKFYGVPGSARWDGETLRGTPAAPGRAVGTARVIMRPSDFTRLEAGDVLVCATTTPAWTPLFASAGALVTDTGGILSHPRSSHASMAYLPWSATTWRPLPFATARRSRS